MIKEMKVIPSKTYATEENAHKAVKKVLSSVVDGQVDVRYFISWNNEGRCFPIFVGESAIQYGIHFHFNVVG